MLWVSCQTLLNSAKQLRCVARVIRLTTCRLPGFYIEVSIRNTLRYRTNALKESNSSFDAKILLSRNAIKDIIW